MADRIVTPAVGLAVSLELAKKHLVIDHEVDDDLIEQVIGAATRYAEQHCGRSILETTWQALFPTFPACPSSSNHDPHLELRRGNLVTDGLLVEYVDEAGDVQTLAASVYLVDEANVPGRIRLAPDQTWPTHQARWDAVRVTYTAGWVVDDIPPPITQALLLLVAQLYENRTPEVTGTIVSPIRFSFEALLSTYRILAL